MLVILPPAYAQLRYSVTDLGTLQAGSFSMAHGINNAGQVVGTADYHAFLYSGGVMTDLGTLPTGTYSHALAINDRGQIVGYSGISGGQERAFLYSGGHMTALSSSISSPTDINNQGQIVGTTPGLHAFLYSNGVIIDLGSFSSANGINDSGQVVGQNYTTKHAFLYSGGVMTDLGTLGGVESAATDINDSGQVVGYSYPTGNTGWRAFLYENAHMTDLGIFSGGQGFYIQAHAINNLGQIVGVADARAFLYSGGRMFDLNTLIPPGARWSLGSAEGINDAGLIVGSGVGPSGQPRAFLLTPLAADPPTVTCSSPLTLECNGGLVVGTVSALVQDSTGLPLTIVWTVDDIPSQTNTIPAGGALNPTNLTFTAAFGSGEHSVMVSASNNQTNPATCSTTVTVRDTTPPSIDLASADPAMLWPPNNQMRLVRLDVRSSDLCGSVTTQIVSVTANEPITAADWKLLDNLSLQLRAKRFGNGGNRVYTIFVECTDDAGNTSTRAVSVTVPHDQRSAQFRGDLSP